MRMCIRALPFPLVVYGKLQIFINHYRTSDKTFSDFRLKVFGGVVKTVIHVSGKTFLGKHVVFEKHFHFLVIWRHLANKFWLSSVFCFHQGCQYCFLSVHRDTIRAKTLSKTFYNFNHFRTMSETFLAICWKKFNGVVETAFYLSSGTFSGNLLLFGENYIFNIILGHWARNFRLFDEQFRRGCQNCILPLHRNICRKFFFWK